MNCSMPGLPVHHQLLAAAAAKSLQSWPTLCDPIDGSPPGSAVPGILQARTLEWVAISYSNAWKWKEKVKSLSRVRLLATPWTAAYQAPPSMGFSRQEYWSGLPLPSLESSWIGDQIRVPCTGRWILNHWATRKVLLMIFFFSSLFTSWGLCSGFLTWQLEFSTSCGWWDNQTRSSLWRANRALSNFSTVFAPAPPWAWGHTGDSHSPGASERRRRRKTRDPPGSPPVPSPPTEHWEEGGEAGVSPQMVLGLVPTGPLGPRKEGREEKLEIHRALLQSPPHPPSIEKRERRLVSVLRRSGV